MTWVRKWGKIGPVMLVILSTILVTEFGVIVVPVTVEPEFHFGLMTVNALFGGFLYSNFGMLVGLLDNETIQKVRGTTIMTKRNTMVLLGIVYAILSVICGLYIVLVSNHFGGVLLCGAINAEIVFMVASMLFYLCSLYEMNCLVKALYRSGSEEKIQKVKTLKNKFFFGNEEQG